MEQNVKRNAEKEKLIAIRKQNINSSSLQNEKLKEIIINPKIKVKEGIE